MSPLKMATS